MSAVDLADSRKPKMMKRSTTIASLCLLFASCSSDHNIELYKDPTQPTERRVESLLSQMTLEEKLDQLDMLVLGKSDNMNNFEDKDGNKLSAGMGAFIFFDTDVSSANGLQKRALEESRLGIPVLLGQDVIHGYRTLFPIPLAQACSWNLDLALEASQVAAKESYLSGLRWTFSPMLDVAQDGRWGRVSESYGEDPYTNAEFAKAVVRGYQGESLNDKYSIASCLKHFAGYAYSQGGRDYNPTNVSNQMLWERVLPPFKAAIESGAATVMSSFNDLNGVPTAANRYLLTEILREKLNFKGFVVSDWRAVEQLITQRYAADSLDAAVKAITAGTDMNMYDKSYRRYLPEAIETGVMDEAYLDEAVRRVLRVKFDLGLFESPYTEVVSDDERYMTPASRELALHFAEESMVLLKNDDATLPLKVDGKRILLVGPMVKDRQNMMGQWRSHAKAKDVVSIYDGVKRHFGSDSTIDYVDGVELLKNDKNIAKKLGTAAKRADIIIVALGELAAWSGENGAKAKLELPNSQCEIMKMVSSYNRPTILLTSSGRPLALSNIEPYANAIVQMWQPGLYGGDAVAKILLGEVNPSGRLAITMPHQTGQVPIFYNQRINARMAWGGMQGKYRDAPIEPLYPFGYGLSYSTFEYSEPKISRNTITRNETTEVTIEVKNSSKIDGKETVFWFVDDVAASVTQPPLKLKYFEKREIKTGDTERFTFKIDPIRDLSFVDATGKDLLENGDFYIVVNNQRVKLTLAD